MWVAFAVSRSCSPHHCYDGYLAHGLVVDRVYQIIEYEPNPCFQRFGESVSTARRAGDEDPDKAIIADTMKLLGNSGYGRTVTNVDRNRDVKLLHRDRYISAHQQQTVSDNWMSSPKTRTK